MTAVAARQGRAGLTRVVHDNAPLDVKRAAVYLSGLLGYSMPARTLRWHVRTRIEQLPDAEIERLLTASEAELDRAFPAEADSDDE